MRNNASVDSRREGFEMPTFIRKVVLNGGRVKCNHLETLSDSV